MLGPDSEDRQTENSHAFFINVLNLKILKPCLLAGVLKVQLQKIMRKDDYCAPTTTVVSFMEQTDVAANYECPRCHGRRCRKIETRKCKEWVKKAGGWGLDVLVAMKTGQYLGVGANVGNDGKEYVYQCSCCGHQFVVEDPDNW